MSHEHGSPEGSNRQDRIFKWVFGGFLLIALYFLLMEHRAHLSGWLRWLPWLLLLACPLMHIFGHGHGGHGGHRHEDSGESPGK
jgi:hypothetical protein